MPPGGAGPVPRRRYQTKPTARAVITRAAMATQARVVEAVAYYPHPERLDASFGIPAAVHVASILSRDARAPAGDDPHDDMRAIPVAYLSSLGVADQLPEWRELAEGAPVSRRSTDS